MGSRVHSASRGSLGGSSTPRADKGKAKEKTPSKRRNSKKVTEPQHFRRSMFNVNVHSACICCGVTGSGRKSKQMLTKRFVCCVGWLDDRLTARRACGIRTTAPARPALRRPTPQRKPQQQQQQHRLSSNSTASSSSSRSLSSWPLASTLPSPASSAPELRLYRLLSFSRPTSSN